MKFGKQLLAESHPPWQTKYVDYKMLKDKIKYKKPQAAEFEALIVQELDKVNKWCQFNSRRLSASTAALESGQENSFTKAEIDYDLVVFRKYILLNTLAVVKIIKKFNRRVKRKLDSSTILSLHFPFSEKVTSAVEGETEKKDSLELLEGFLKSELAVTEDQAAVRQIRCHSCHQPIYGEFVSFEGRLFHPGTSF